MKIFPYIIVLLSAILWGTTGTTQTFLQGDISPIAVACIRSAIGGGALLIITLSARMIHWQTWPWKWNILAAISIALFQGFFFSSIRYTGVAIGTVVTIGSAPVFAGILEWLIWKVKPTKTWVISTTFAIVGCILLFAVGGDTTVNSLGILLALSGGCMFALYTNVSKRLTEKAATLPAVAMTFSLCAVLLVPFAWQGGFSWMGISENIWTMTYMGLMATSLAYVLFLGGLRAISSSAAVTLSLAEPLTAALLGAFFLGEYLAWTSWLGVVLIFAGILVLTIGTRVSR
ncbi:EamA family transporter [Lysinibacillus macroides]|uniref:Transporter n=1 Tax=Lysinibacillus macroides TaxID=33935 RepID=A0A0N1J085_9BACI|nr:EamA family transporter [Lysinibacillus macroides]KOY82341.1 transporter [Lysinibacillus macroides]QPR66619.1 EamA family transporter [Lysinibacillus macroides]